MSVPASINRSIIQGSGIGLTLYIAMKSDLTTLDNNCNVIIKYADDVDLLVPEHSTVDLSCEFNNVKDWAAKNKIIINFQKTKELVFHRPNPRNIFYPGSVETEQVKVAKLLGCSYSSTFVVRSM